MMRLYQVRVAASTHPLETTVRHANGTRCEDPAHGAFVRYSDGFLTLFIRLARDDVPRCQHPSVVGAGTHSRPWGYLGIGLPARVQEMAGGASHEANIRVTLFGQAPGMTPQVCERMTSGRVLGPSVRRRWIHV